ncbi:MAG: FixH family protein [Massilia sp.]
MHPAPPMFADPPPPWYTQRWPWLLMLGPALVIAGGSYASYLAWKGQDAMVVDDYYKQGKAINQDLRRDRAATALGMAMQLRYDAASGLLSGAVQSRGQPHVAPVYLYLAHATQPDKDIKLLAVPDAQGRFVLVLPALAQARWQVVVEGAQRDWRLARSWHWPREAALDLAADQPGPGA